MGTKLKAPANCGGFGHDGVSHEVVDGHIELENADAVAAAKSHGFVDAETDEEKVAAEKAEADRVAAEAEVARLAAEKEEADRVAAEKKAVYDALSPEEKLAADKVEDERLAAEAEKNFGGA